MKSGFLNMRKDKKTQTEFKRKLKDRYEGIHAIPLFMYDSTGANVANVTRNTCRTPTNFCVALKLQLTSA